MKLSEFELDVMQFLWDNGPLTAPEVHQMLSEVKDVTYSTVKTIIDRLEEKGAIKREKSVGRTIIYSANVAKSAISDSLLPSFLRRFFEGDPRQLITRLIEEEELDKEDIQYLQALLKKRAK